MSMCVWCGTQVHIHLYNKLTEAEFPNVCSREALSCVMSPGKGQQSSISWRLIAYGVPCIEKVTIHINIFKILRSLGGRYHYLPFPNPFSSPSSSRDPINGRDGNPTI